MNEAGVDVISRVVVICLKDHSGFIICVLYVNIYTLLFGLKYLNKRYILTFECLA